MMKQNLCFAAPAVLLLSFTAFPHTLEGTWISKGPNNTRVLLDFKSNGDFKVTVGKEIENEGRYVFQRDTFRMYDNNCGTNVEGKYKITFYTPDSASFTLINDPCKSRADEVDGGQIKRVKDAEGH